MDFIVSFSIPLIVIVLLLAIGRLTVFPKFKWKVYGKNSSFTGVNTLFYANADPFKLYPLSIAAQEIAESHYKWNPIHLFKRLSSDKGKRNTEAFGRTVEIEALISIYRESRSRDQLYSTYAIFLNRTYPAFKKTSVSDIVELLRKTTPAAKKWWEKNNKYILSLEKSRLQLIEKHTAK